MILCFLFYNPSIAISPFIYIFSRHSEADQFSFLICSAGDRHRKKKKNINNKQICIHAQKHEKLHHFISTH